MTTIWVDAVAALPAPLPPVKVTTYVPACALVGVQLKDPVLLPRSVKLALLGGSKRVSVTWRDC